MKIERQVDQIIHENMPAISAGEVSVESILARYPRIEAQLRPRLEAAILLHQLRYSIATRPGFIHDSRKYLETKIISMQPRHSWQRLFRIHTPQRWAVNLATLTLLVITLVALMNDMILAARLAIPSEPLYSIKLFIEDIELALTINQTAKMDLHIQFTRERTSEIAELILHGDYEYLPTAARRLESEITIITYSLEDTPMNPQNDKLSFIAKFDETLNNVVFMLKILKWTSPSSASASINLAIQAAQSGMLALH